MSLMTDYNPHFVKKVYCKNCKWEKYNWCWHPSHKNEEPILIALDCFDYKRKWWRTLLGLR